MANKVLKGMDNPVMEIHVYLPFHTDYFQISGFAPVGRKQIQSFNAYPILKGVLIYSEILLLHPEYI